MSSRGDWLLRLGKDGERVCVLPGGCYDRCNMNITQPDRACAGPPTHGGSRNQHNDAGHRERTRLI